MIFDSASATTSPSESVLPELPSPAIVRPAPAKAPMASKSCDIPTRAGEVTTAWLNMVLAPHLDGHLVLGSQARPFSDPGQTADIVEISLHYDSNDCALPDKMIAKLSALDPDTRQMCKTFRHYERETGFYAAFSGDELPIARCFHTDFDPDTLDQIILMEHLAPSQSLSYAITVDHVRTAIRQVARLHARWWNDEFVKQQPALVQLDDGDHWPSARKGGLAAMDRGRQLVGSRCEASIAAMTAFAENFDAAMAHIRSRPFTLQHADYHGKQMFFPNDEGEGRFAIIDWQFSVAGPAAWDIARICNLGLDYEVRQQCQDELIGQYLAELARGGVENYDREQFWTDYKLGIFMTQLINFIAVNQTDAALLERECAESGLDWKEVWLMRGERMMEEKDVAGFIQSL